MIRDDRLCIFTKYDEPGVYATRIVPFKLNGKTPHQEMWKLLKVFWGDKVAKWQEKLCVQCDDLSIDTEKVYNMLSLNGVIQQCWDAGWVAFRPISVNKENTSMKIKFHWIAVDIKVDELGKRLDKIKLNQIPHPLLDEDFWCKRQSRMDRKRLWHQTENRLALDGDILTVTTDDPVKRSLASMELLELQWILTRIAAVQGKADDDNQRD